jgi:hypothetical protein
MTTIIDITTGSESSWSEETYPGLTADNVNRNDDFIVQFSKSVAAVSLISTNFVLMTPDGAELDEPFRQIDLRRDYNSITKKLVLHLSRELLPEQEYAFIIRDLLDPAGQEQDQQHVVTFTTNDYNGTVSPTTFDDVDLLPVIDHTMAGEPGAITRNEQVGAAKVVRSQPTDGMYNLTAGYLSGLITVLMNGDVHSVDVEVLGRAISNMEVPWAPIAATADVDDTNTRLINIQMPEILPGEYYAAGTEYLVRIGAGTEIVIGGTSIELGNNYDIQLTGMLTPMFASLKDVIFYIPNLEPIKGAIEIYLNSKYVMEVMPDTDQNNPPKSASDYALYATLYRLTSNQTSADAVTLGDFQVKHSVNSSLSDRFKALMDNALSRLTRVGPKVVIKGGSEVSPFSSRTW